MKYPPGLTVMKIGVMGINKAENDPEHTMHLELTHRECAIISFGNMLISMLFPELCEHTNSFASKLLEVGIAQDYLPDPKDIPEGWPDV